MQTWSLSHLQKLLLNTIKNPLPIGFIYVQLPNEKSPTEIWPWMIWKDVTSEYAGLFFRAEGREAASFGQVQEDNAPRLSRIQFTSNRKDYDADVILPKGGSRKICTGMSGGTNDWFFNYYISDGEVRPRNMAIRIWKRTG